MCLYNDLKKKLLVKYFLNIVLKGKITISLLMINDLNLDLEEKIGGPQHDHLTFNKIVPCILYIS